MRFDDRLTTLLSAQPADAEGRAALWAQMADVVAQAGDTLSDEMRGAIGARMDAWQHDVSPARRRLVSAAIASPRTPVELVFMFAFDAPQIAAPVLSRARLAADEWIRLIHATQPASRNILRQRRDLPIEAVRTLAVYAATDLALPAGEGAPAPSAEPIQIRDLVARIEAYRKDHPTRPLQPDLFGVPRSIRIETGADHVIEWVDGMAREALLGVSLEDVAPRGHSGASEAVRQAVAARQAFEDGRIFVTGSGPASGWWSLDGLPHFDESGRFAGFRCVAVPADNDGSDPLLAIGLAPDSIRQLVHELRTPLNAIRGFAEMIAGQFLGPVAHGYRSAAQAISRDSMRLSAVIDDLDLAARLDSHTFTPSSGQADIGRIVRRRAAALQDSVEEQRLRLQIKLPTALPLANVADDDAERLIDRLLTSIANGSNAGGTVSLNCYGQGATVVLDVSRAEDGREQDAPDAGTSLGTDFEMRLAATFAEACGGRLDTGTNRFALILPAVTDSAHLTAASG